MTSSPPQPTVPAARHSAPEELPPVAGRKRHPRPKRGGGFRFLMFNIVIPFAILVLGGLALWAFGEQQPAVRPADDNSFAGRLERIPAVETLPVRSLEAVGGRLDLQVDGVVVPFREVQVATEVAGTILFKAPECEAGTYVQEGQLLIRVDSTDYQNEVERLSQLKEQEYQAIRELEQELVNANRLLEVAREDVALQEREIARLEKLPAGYASDAEIDQAKRARLQAVNARVQLENELDLMQRRRSRLEAAEKLADAQLRLAQTNLERTEIRAPVSGVVYREDAELNSFVQRGEVIVTIEDTSKAEVAVNLRTDQLYWILDQARRGSGDLMPTVGGSARSYSLPPTEASILYQVAGREDEIFRWEGVLERYDGIGFDAVSRTVPVRIVVDEPRRYKVGAGDGEGDKLKGEDVKGGGPVLASSGPSALVRGMFVSVVLHVEPKRNLVVVPAVGLKPGNRVWKFIPDPSVVAAGGGADSAAAGALDSGAAGEAGDAPQGAGEAAAPVGGAASVGGEEASEFEPDQWVAGRLVVLEDLRPIQASHLVAGEQAEGEWSGGAEDKPDFWVCEVGQGELKAGSRIVISPLPSFEGRGTDYVRVPRGQVTAASEVASQSPRQFPADALPMPSQPVLTVAEQRGGLNE